MNRKCLKCVDFYCWLKLTIKIRGIAVDFFLIFALFKFKGKFGGFPLIFIVNFDLFKFRGKFGVLLG